MSQLSPGKEKQLAASTSVTAPSLVCAEIIENGREILRSFSWKMAPGLPRVLCMSGIDDVDD